MSIKKQTKDYLERMLSCGLESPARAILSPVSRRPKVFCSVEVRNTLKIENLGLNTFMLFLRFQNVILQVKHNEPLLVSKKGFKAKKSISRHIQKRKGAQGS